MSPAASSRWCPTPEQLMILEELYRTGIRTPNASQIQHITAQLSFYGKIEGKNVFYWFQNHKARDRQKLRRKLGKQHQQQQQQEHQLYNHHQLQQNHPNYFEPPAACAFHQLSHHHPSTLLRHEGGLEGARAANYRWNLEMPEIRESAEKSMMMYEQHDWMMLMNLSSLPIQCSSTRSTFTTARPLKTLELFPVTATNLKEEE